MTALLDRLTAAYGRLRRATPGSMLIRGTVFVAGFLALCVAMPAGLLSAQTVLAAAVLALVPAALPGSFAVMLAQLLTVALWVIGTLTGPIALGSVLMLAAALYLQHTAAALAAVLPLDSFAAPAVVLGWLARTAGVLAAGLGLGLLVGLLGPAGTTGALSYVATGAGLVLAAVTGILLAWQYRRRSR